MICTNICSVGIEIKQIHYQHLLKIMIKLIIKVSLTVINLIIIYFITLILSLFNR